MTCSMSAANACARAAHCATPAESPRIERKRVPIKRIVERFAVGVGGGAEFLPGHAPFLPAQPSKQGLQRLLEQRREFRDGARSNGERRQFRARVVQQRIELAARTRDAEKLGREIGQLVRFIEDQCIDARQQLAETPPPSAPGRPAADGG